MEKPVYIMAEIGQAHDGSLGIAHSYIDALADTGVNAIKFQVHIADAESSIFEKFRTEFSYEDENRMAYWRRMEFSLEQWKGLKMHCTDKHVDFVASPFSNAAVDILSKLNAQVYKVGSGEITNMLLLHRIAEEGKDVILSSGMSSFTELDAAVDFFKSRNINLSILQCTTSYPTTPDQWGLNCLSILKQRYLIPTGFSDHSGDLIACLAATSLGAEILEFHAVFDQRMFGPDASSSMTINQIRTLVKGTRQIERALQNPVDKNDISKFDQLKINFEKSLVCNKLLKAGTCISFKDLDASKPKGFGISGAEFQKIIGKEVKRTIQQWDFIAENDLI